MATVNIGNIKFNWKGPWSNSTTYAVDDVVSLSGSSYISIQAGSNQNPASASAYWQQMSSAGTNGTNGDTFGLANKEIAFKTNAGALDGIAIGTAGQALKVNSGATGYEFGAVAGGKVLQVVTASTETNVSTTSTSYVHLTNIPTFNITPSATSSKILLLANFGATEISGNNGYVSIFRGSNNLGNSTAGFVQVQHSSSHRLPLGGAVYLDSPSTASQITYDIRIKTSNGDGFNFGEGCSVNLVAMEIGA